MRMEDASRRWDEFLRARCRDQILLLRESYPKIRSLIVNFLDVVNYDVELADELLQNPDQSISSIKQALADSSPNLAEVNVRISNVPETVRIRELRGCHISKLIAVEGLVRRCQEVRPRLIEGAFECQYCHHITYMKQNGGRVREPPMCENETCKGGRFRLIVEKSRFIDCQKLVIEELPETLRGSEQPQRLDVYVEDEFAGIVCPGDKVRICGILRSYQRQRIAAKYTTFDIVLEALHISVEEKGFEEIDISEGEMKQIIELGKDPNIFERIKRSIAPSIFGYGNIDKIKGAIALQLFSGVRKELPDGSNIRGDIHLLLVGDPGTAKSMLLRYVKSLAPRGIYTAGLGSTAAGLTATAVRDDEGRWTLEAGALVMADDGICMVDEIDKMRDEDRTALHEALEQQSYHPSFEITLADGSKHRIGEFVDALFEKFPDRKIEGINCEILDVSDLGIEILTADFNTCEAYKARVSRVSRHSPPEYFVKITYSNGREILVTPEHPVFVFREGKTVTVPASEVRAGDFAPALLKCEFFCGRELDTHMRGRKKVSLPDEIDESFGSFLGFFASEGYSYPPFEIGLSNTNPSIIDEMEGSIGGSFHLRPMNYVGVNRTLRIVSKPVYDFMISNFPELMKKSKERRLPPQIFSADDSVRAAFLRSAFMGDGCVENESISYSTACRGLAEDYQDLLLTLGIHSRICSDRASKSYKVYITGDSIHRFATLVMDDERIRKLAERSARAMRNHDVLPAYTGVWIRECLRKLGMRYDGCFNEHLEANYGINRAVVDRYLGRMERRIEEIRSCLKNHPSLRELRRKLGYSQEKLGKLVGVCRREIDYAERGGYSEERRRKLVDKAIDAAERLLLEVEQCIKKIRDLEKFRWLRVKKITTVPNSGDHKARWVYDVTVEPTHTFISHGIVLHNTISIAKAGITATLKCRCSLLAAANPKYGKFDPSEPLANQVDLPPTLLSRFDLIFPIEDRPDEEMDAKLADHILNTHYIGEEHAAGGKAEKTSIHPEIPPDLLRKYISYARKNVFPRLSDEAKEEFKRFYTRLRSQGSGETVPIDARRLEALIRLGEASARMRLSNVVTKEDAERAISLMLDSLHASSRDVVTGQIDVGVINVGISHSKRNLLRRIRELMVSIIGEEKSVLEGKLIFMTKERVLRDSQLVKLLKDHQKLEECIRRMMEKEGIGEEAVEKILRDPSKLDEAVRKVLEELDEAVRRVLDDMERDGTVYKTQKGEVRLVNLNP